MTYGAAGFRASPQQRHLWPVSNGADRSLWQQLTVVVEGSPDPARLASAVREAGSRHEILRTRVAPLAGHQAPVQYIEDTGPEPAGPDECGPAVEAAPGDGEPLAALDLLATAERDRLDPAAGPAVRLTLAQLDAGRYGLVLTAHPLVADRRSLRGLLTEIAAGYAHDRPGAPGTVQYADFAAWHSELLGDQQRAQRREFWDRHTDPRLLQRGAQCVTTNGGQSGAWRTRQLAWDDGGAAAIGALAAACGTGEDAVVAAAWATVLWRLGGEQDLAIAATLPGRTYAELAAALGPFARDLPLAIGVTADDTFQELVVRVAGLLADAAEHADDLDPARLTGRPVPPAYEYVEATEPVVAAEVTFRPIRETGRGAAPLVLLAGRAADGGGWLELGHDDQFLPTEHAARLLGRVQVVLRTGVTQPATPVTAISMLLADERDRLVAAGRGPVAPTSEQTLHRLLREQVRRTPAAPAVDDGGSRLSYAELDRRSDRFARQLAEAGVAPGRRVVVHMERSCDFMVCLWGVLKAGAAYVPVDLRQPAPRLAFVIDDVGSPLLVTGADTPVPASLPVPVLRYRPDRGPTGGEPPADRASADDLAYVMYTSGSTGTPNGVPVTHRSLVNYLLWAAVEYELREGTGALVHSSIGFDLTVTGLLAPLLVGQRVVLLPEKAGLAGLVSALAQARDVTLLKVTPSHLAALAQLTAPEQFADRVRTLVIGGEQLRAELLEPLRTGASRLRIVNEYGPTETVVGSCAYLVGPQTPRSGPVPIGAPIAGATAYLLDPQMRPVPEGVPGELYLGGVGVADGYLARPELTRERFHADPFTPGGRLYRTGDRARRLASGELVYLGRTDDQLKVRGYRVEPGEIEAVLSEHPGVAETAVAVSEARAGEPGGAEPMARLVAGYVLSGGGGGPSATELAEHCRARLPDYLVPAVFAPVEELPTTPNGKRDRAALARLVDQARSAGTYLPPRTETEEILAGAIGTVLGSDRVGIDDNYFVLGGDSIRSVMVASRLQARGLEVSVVDLHRHPTVRELAEAISTERADPPEPQTRPFDLVTEDEQALLPPDVEDAFPLNLLQEGMIFHRDFAAKSAVYHAIASVRLRAPFDLTVMRQVVRQLVERHPMLRTSFDLTTFGRPLQLVHRSFPDPLSYEDLRGHGPAEQQARIEGWVEAEKQRGFELDEFPLIRFMAQRLDDETFQFTYGFHHEIVDGWSEALLVTELFGHYFSLVFDEPLTLRPPTSSMRDAVALEQQALQRQENYDFWSHYLADATLMRLPRPHLAPAADTGAREIARLAVPVPAELSDALKRLATTDSVPLKSVLLAGHMAVMHLYHGQADTLTYTVTNGRPESADGSTAIGLFVNSLALRLRMHGGSWTELIAQTLEAERQSMPYRRLPMAELKRHQGNEPLAETLFFFTDYHVFRELERWRDRGVEHVASELYGESTFPFCAIFRLNRETSQIEVRIEYDSLQFTAELMDRVADCYVEVLRAMVVDPQAAYHTRSLLAEDEHQRVLTDWNGADPVATDVELITDLVTRRCQQHPDAIAVECDGAALSYASLDRSAARVARVLRAHGAAPGATVALLTGRSLEAVVCLLGVLKAGAAYLPLDPTYPPERVKAILERSAPVVVLADPELAAEISHPSVLAVEPGLPFLTGPTAPAAGTAPPAQATGDHAAYVIHTSGSTGEPKGVVVTHRGLLNATLARTSVYPQPPQRFLLLSSLAFDSSVAGLFWPLCTGGTLVVAPEGRQLEPAKVGRDIEAHRVTHTLCVPSLLTALLEAGRPERLASLQVVIAAGEACSRELHEACLRALPGAALYNEYGPTENTVWSTAWSGQPIAHRPQLPIGRPVPGVRAYVLSCHGQPVPVGVAGELYLGGASLALGYLDRPGLTAAAFLPDPFTSVPGARMYRSGDLARHTPDGQLDFLGRADNQVKIRGFRVELGEIEGVLDTYPGVQRSVVLARADGSAEQTLAAYLTAQPGARLDPADLPRYARDRLPKYMVPASWMVLDTLPLTSTGKIDRASLPAPHPPAAAPALALPRTETEQVIVAIWSQALDRTELGVHDDFFDVGGESLRAMQVVTKTNQVFGLELSVRSLFDSSTVAAFAEMVDAARVTERAAVRS